jgi:cell division septation protein DedD
MDNALKQRILGIIVLFALVGICITVLLHNNKVARQEGIQKVHQLVEKQIPSTPTSSTTSTETTPSAAAMTSASVFSQSSEPAPTPSSSTPVPTEQPLESSVPSSPNVTEQTEQTITQTTSTPSSVHHARTKTKTTTSVESVVTPSTNNLPTESTTKSSAEVVKTFSVQVGTFSNHENALALVKALHERGFNSAIAQSIKTKHGTMTRVVIGEKGLTRKEAETTKLRLSKTLQLKGIISPVDKTTESKITEKKSTSSTTATKSTHKHTHSATTVSTKSHETPASAVNTASSTTSDTNNSGAVVIP